MVVLVIHDPGDLMSLQLVVLVGVLLFFGIFNVLSCLLCFSNSRLSLGSILDRSREDRISLFLHN